MNIFDYIKTRVMKLIGLLKLPGTPNTERLTYINDDEAIRISNIRANRYWYIGDGNELLNWYTNRETYGFAENPIYNRNMRNYFWGKSINENMKRVHSGIPKAIVDTISNLIGMPAIDSNKYHEVLNRILEVNNFEYMLTKRSRPMTLVEGDCAWKINISPALADVPLIEHYGAEDWAPIYKSNILCGMTFLSYYKDANNKNYVLYEIRSKHPDGLAIEYKLFRLGKENTIVPVSLETIPQLKDYHSGIFKGIHSLLAVPNRYYYDPLRVNRGKSIYDGKLDLFDFLDEILTQASQTNRVSTPVEYFPTDLLQRGKNGETLLPKTYNRQYVQVDSTVDGDGHVNNQIQTTQPNLYFDKYSQLFWDNLKVSLIGLISPSSLGVDVSRKDNAEAQREKEKQTLFTRQNIMTSETKTLLKLCNMCLEAYDYMHEKPSDSNDYGISIKYGEFSNPSFEFELQILGPAWNSGQISTERFVTMLWGSKLSEEELRKEIEWLDMNKIKENADLKEITDVLAQRNREYLQEEEQSNNDSEDTSQQVLPNNL